MTDDPLSTSDRIPGSERPLGSDASVPRENRFLEFLTTFAGMMIVVLAVITGFDLMAAVMGSGAHGSAMWHNPFFLVGAAILTLGSFGLSLSLWMFTKNEKVTGAGVATAIFNILFTAFLIVLVLAPR